VTIPATAPASPARVRLPTHPVRVTYACLGLVSLIFIAQFAFQAVLGFDPIIVYGAKENTLIAHGQVWRLLTAIFIHGNVLHFLFNAYALYYLGRQVETFSGSLRFSLVFLLAGISGTVTSMLLNRFPSVGASGAIFGLIGAEVVFLYRHREMLGQRGRGALQNIALIAALNLFFGLRGGIDNWAHLGGLVGGLALSWFIGPVWALNLDPASGGQPTVEDRQPLAGARWAAVAAYAAGLVTLAGVAIALRR
jgi:rhomboid protease GluP